MTTLEILQRAKAASYALALLSTNDKNRALLAMANALEAHTEEILAANEADILAVKDTMNPVMIDGTGMCGGCRLTVGGKTVFACVDGPEFDGALIDFDEAIARSSMYRDFERHRYEEACNLFAKEVK